VKIRDLYNFCCFKGIAAAVAVSFFVFRSNTIETIGVDLSPVAVAGTVYLDKLIMEPVIEGFVLPN
jgi:hypothetical protein